MRLVIFVEEPSMREFLHGLIPRVAPDCDYLIITHEGKSDLEASIPRKLANWQAPGDRFLILRDNDGGDCRATKAKLAGLCDRARRQAVVRMVCQHLECWYLGDLAALGHAFSRPAIAEWQHKAKYRTPDERINGSSLVKELIGPYGKVAAAREMGRLMNLEANASPSFNATLSAVRRLTRAAAGSE